MKKLLLSCSLAIGFFASAQTTVIFEDSFESYTDFAIADVGSWTLRDIDLKTTYGITSGGAPVVFANSGVAKSFQVFNSTTTVPASGAGFSARTGVKNMVCFNADSAPWNDDWLISPQISITSTGSSAVSFWVKPANAAYGLEKFQVFVSTTGTEIADFTAISPVVTTPADVVWKEHAYDLTAYAGQAIHIAIRCTSDDQFALSLDDFKVTNTAPATAAPDCATLTTPSNNNTSVNPGSVTLSWTAPTTGGAPSSYDVYFGTTANPTTLLGSVVGTSIAATTVANTTYYWRVVPKNTVGSATGCSTFSFKTITPIAGCTTIANNSPYGALVPSNCNGTTAVSRTFAYAGEYSTVSLVAGRSYKFDILLKSGYYITIATDAATPVVLASGANSVTYTAATTGLVRFYSHANSTCIGATDSTSSHTRSVTCLGTLAVSDLDKSNVSIYPNPFTDVLKISDVKGVKSVSVNDISGREVKSLAPSAELNLSSLQAGLYIVNLKMEDGSVKSFKAIKK
ncbi:T9SS-dependent choice-of-anchor J family protein [Epilithonimonas lactis]|uniref:T9SS-dependent choice-of-anchor J family protein n=1 Tax=Epilithonimonas lactis TaxID=421072 RepID=UPI00068C213F|nr:choice-of-anchor J domain-containing protein [Epilithonimonas lactis]SEQ61171.1 Por secretion system C-terminal sorting domain-containing protein [Epilithonimonas lactis]